MKRILVPILLLAVLAFSRTAGYVQRPVGRTFQNARHDINNLTMVISNFGTFGQDETGNNGGLWWRYSGYEIDRYYIYGAGPWFGTITEEGDTLVTIGYGPSGGQFEFGCGLAGMSVGNPDAIIYTYPAPWPPPADVFPTAPATYLSHQDSWCAINDLDITYHMPGDTRPIGLEVYQTVYAWNLSTTADIIFLKFDCKNVSGQILNPCYFGVIADCDIGNEAGPAANDRCTAIIYREYMFPGDTVARVVDNLGYQWQDDPEGGWPIFPGTIGFDYLQSPYDLVPGEDKDGDGIPDQYERDSVYFANNVPPAQWDVDADGTPDWRDPSEIPQLGLTSFRRFTLDLEPSRDNARFLTMAGYNFVTGQYDPYDTIIPDPADQRFGQCSGPFELLPESTVTVLVGVMVTAFQAPAPAGYPLYAQPDSALVWVDQTAQFIFDQNWLLPGPPPPPNVTLIPGDAQITLTWDTFAETAADPYYDVVGADSLGVPYNPALYDSFYLQYDFQGYGLWKSTDGLEWELLARYDRADGIAFEDTVLGIYARETGLLHAFTDTDVRNGFPYYYSVTAFDYNYVTAETSGVEYGQPIWFESGRVPFEAVARRDPANYVAGAYDVNAVYGNPALAENNIELTITVPLEMTADPMYLDFLPIEYDDGNPRYSVELLDRDYNLLEQYAVTLGLGQEVLNQFPAYQGLSIAPVFVREDIASSQSIFEYVEVESGTYPDTFPVEEWLVPIAGPTNWAYRGNDYRVYWRVKEGSDSVNTVTVVDVQAGDTIPFKPYLENTATAELADGWCFRALTSSTDTLVYGTVPAGTRNLYICGGKFKLKNLNQLAPGDPRPSANDVWFVKARESNVPAPSNARLQIVPIPAAYADTAVTMNVKVVPNPYIIYNEWQTTTDVRRMRFINLPAECTIRIYNLNGELVRMIRHAATSEESDVVGDLGGDEWWDLLSDNRQLVASGVYIFHVQSQVGEQVGKFVVVH
jgi:hypothetical protein